MTITGPAERIKPVIRVLLVDDQIIVRKGIRALLAEVEYIEVAGEAGSGQEAVAKAQSLDPDVIVMDLAMPDMDGIEAIRQIMAHDTRAHVLVLTSFSSDDKVFPAVKAGATGYLLKESQPSDLIRAIEQVSRGQAWLHPTIAGRLLGELRCPTRKIPPESALTSREAEVMRLVAKGMGNGAIAAQMDTKASTIKTLVSAILSKLHLDSRVQVALVALQEGAESLHDRPIAEPPTRPALIVAAAPCSPSDRTVCD